MEIALPSIPAKRYFSIGEVSDLCRVKPYVLRYWEQEFTQLKPMKRRGNRRYYQHHEVLLIRRIRELLYDEGFTISGARNRLSDAPPGADGASSATAAAAAADAVAIDVPVLPSHAPATVTSTAAAAMPAVATVAAPAQFAWVSGGSTTPLDAGCLRAELLSIRELLTA